MKTLNIISSLMIAAIIVFLSLTCAFAYDAEYNSNINNLQNVSLTVQNQGGDESCLAYALAATAESYCIKNEILNGRDFTFSGETLRKNVGDSTNFGTVLYSSVNYSLGNDCYITGIENLTGRGERYLKRKIEENGAIFVAIPLPENGMQSKDYFNENTCSLNCKDAGNNVADFSGGINHAVSVVGWDDTYSYENYNGGRARNGAWICKNSYGKEWGKDGYFYLSYDYTGYFLYSVAVEVTQYTGIVSARPASKPYLGFKKAGAVGFRYGKNLKNAEVTIASDGAEDQTIKAEVSNGFTFVPLSKPVFNSDIKVEVDGQEIPSSELTIYYIELGRTLSAPSKPQSIEKWDIAVDNLDIDLYGSPFTASSDINGNTVFHKVMLSSTDNRFTVVPQDGYRFTENTEVSIKKTIADHVDPKEIRGKISELEDELTFADKKLTIKSKNIGGAFASGLRIELDENSIIKNVFLIENNGSEKELKAGEYSIETSPKTIPDKGVYYVEVKISGYYAADDFKVILTRNDENNEISPADILTEGDYISVGVIINIPDITQDAFELLINFINIFTSIANALRINR